MKVERFDGETSSIAQLFSDYYDKGITEETLRRHLRAPIAICLRKMLEGSLGKVLAQRRSQDKSILT